MRPALILLSLMSLRPATVTAQEKIEVTCTKVALKIMTDYKNKDVQTAQDYAKDFPDLEIDVVKPKSMTTLDVRRDRVRINVDENGKVIKARCG